MSDSDKILTWDGVAGRRDSFRFDILDRALNHVGSVQPGGDTPVVIDNDTGRPIQRTMSNFVLPSDAGAEFQTAGLRVRPYLVLENGDSRPLGTFLFTDARKTTDSKGTRFDGSLMDLGFLVDQASTRAFGLDQGDRIAPVIRSILLDRGILEAHVIDTGVKIGGPIGWQPGTSWLQIVNQLCGLAGCLPVFFDAMGEAHVIIAPDPARTDPAIVYESGLNIIDQGIARWDDVLTAPNLFVVVETGLANSPIVGQYAVPASAPNSFYNIGVEIPLVKNEQGMESQSSAEERARVYSITEGVVYEHIAFTGPLDWRHSTFDLLDVLGEKWLERRWSMTLRYDGAMTHEGSKVYE